jgi:DNA-binding response OmpR family regulator
MQTVLIVDDDTTTADVYAHMLTLDGYRVLKAYSAAEALIETAIERPDVVILDLRMPMMDGLGLLERWRVDEHLKDMRVVIVTGDYFIEDDIVDRLRVLGADLRYKPLWAEDLVGILTSHAGKHS